jgi:signal transduction histidine kinase
VTNLVGNAIKFTPSGGRIQVTTQVQDKCVTISVADTGCGIAPEELPKVFDKFFRGPAITRETRGAGLGLAIAKSLVELHGGTIWVDSTVGVGSTFCFTIPLQRAEESPGVKA